MNTTVPTIPILNLLLAFVPVAMLVAIMRAWSLNAWQAVYANGRMLVQLLVIGYVLTLIFESNNPWIVVLIVVFMIAMSAWIALRPLSDRGVMPYVTILVGIGVTGVFVLVLTTQLILDLQTWYEPRFVVPLAGMVFANSMNTISIAGERYQAERNRGEDYPDARNAAMTAALIPQINTLLAVGLVALPGMMTGQVLSGVDPLVAARYQIMVMCMIFSTAGLAAVLYLVLRHMTDKPVTDSASD